MGRPADAEREFQRAVQIWPDLMQARVNLGIALYQEGKFASAEASFEEALRRDPNNATALKFMQALRLHEQSPVDSSGNQR